MPTLEPLLASVRATSLAEWVAVAAGVLYIVLIIRRNRFGWVAGGVSSLILAVLVMRARLPMQSLLQVSYVIAAVYGWWSWSRNAGSQPQRVSTWTLRGHLLALLVCAAISLGLAQLLAREGYSAFPFTDSMLACGGLLATWMVARVYLENWLYWIVIDSVSIYLYAAQGLVVTAGLFVIYLVMAGFGLRSWWRIRRDQQASL